MVTTAGPGPMIDRFLAISNPAEVRVMEPLTLGAKSMVPPLGVRPIACRRDPLPLSAKFVTVVNNQRSSSISKWGRNRVLDMGNPFQKNNREPRIRPDCKGFSLLG